MAGCRIVKQSVETAEQKIVALAANYKNAGQDFINDLNNAIAEMEGEAKDALKTLIDGDVKEYVEESLPAAVNGMFELLKANRENFETVDKQIADSISGN